MATTAAGTRQEELAFIRVDGVRIAYADTGGTGTPLVLVHGSWGSHHNWDAVVPGLAERFRVVSYDRRGHSESQRPPGHGHFSEDVADLAALIEQLGVAPAWVVGSSFGAAVTVKLAAARPEILRGIVAHEPPLFGLLEAGSQEAHAVAEIESGPLTEVGRRIATGDHAGAAEQFAEQVALGPGSWARLPEAMRAMMIANAPTFLDELRDTERLLVGEAELARYGGPALLTSGDQSPPIFQHIERQLAKLLPHASRITYSGAGHIPHVTHPEEYVAALVGFIESHEVDRR
ncbi:alpha/beta fold hydrolase [Nocardioides sp. NPDC058538]|uniref:alpha/beta fold hydrolase n=1 Tax=Nocardioides sp. NPDC058538 TaxID=3346542 RepID=UPI0036643A18